MMRWFSSSSPSFSVCTPSMTPINRDGTTVPIGTGSSMSTRTSSGSPSSPAVDGMNPKSKGKLMPCGKTFLTTNAARSRSYASFVRAPRFPRKSGCRGTCLTSRLYASAMKARIALIQSEISGHASRVETEIRSRPPFSSRNEPSIFHEARPHNFPHAGSSCRRPLLF